MPTIFKKLPDDTSTSNDRKRFLMTIVGLSVTSVLCAFLFSFVFERSRVSYEILFVSTLICVLGYLITVLPVAYYLRVFSPIWMVVGYFMNLALIMLLIFLKFHLIQAYPNIAHSSLLVSLFTAYISAALFEEIIKIIVYSVPFLFNQFDSIYGLIMMATNAGASFGTIENLLVADQGISVSLQRFALCTASHTSDCLVGCLVYCYIKCGMIEKHVGWYYPLILILPIVLHGTYDYLLFVSRDLSIPWLGTISFLTGLASIGLALAMFYPLRRENQNPIDVCQL